MSGHADEMMPKPLNSWAKRCYIDLFWQKSSEFLFPFFCGCLCVSASALCARLLIAQPFPVDINWYTDTEQSTQLEQMMKIYFVIIYLTDFFFCVGHWTHMDWWYGCCTTTVTILPMSYWLEIWPQDDRSTIAEMEKRNHWIRRKCSLSLIEIVCGFTTISTENRNKWMRHFHLNHIITS